MVKKILLLLFLFSGAPALCMQGDYAPMDLDSPEEEWAGLYPFETDFSLQNFSDIDVFFYFGISDDSTSNNEDEITIITKEGHSFKIPVAAAKRAGTLKDLIKDAGIQNPIPLPDIPAKIWGLIQGQLEQEEAFKLTQDSEDIELWEPMMFDVYKDLKGQSLVNLMYAANYLDMPLLLKMTTTIAKECGVQKISSSQLQKMPKELANPILFAGALKTLRPSLCRYIGSYPNSYKFRYCNGSGQQIECLWNKVVQVWDSETKQRLLSFEFFLDAESSVCATPDGKNLLVGTSGNGIREMDVAKGTYNNSKYKGHTGVVSALAVTSNSEKIVSGSHDTTVRIWNRKSGKQLVVCTGHTAPVHTLCVTHDNSKIVSSAWDDSLRIWDIASGKQIAHYKRPPSLLSMCIMSDDTHLVTNHFGGKVCILNIKTGEQLAGYQGVSRYPFLTVGAQGKHILLGCGDNSVQVWDVSGLLCLQKLQQLAKRKKGQVWQMLKKVDKITISRQEGVRELKDIVLGVKKVKKEKIVAEKKKIKTESVLNYNKNGNKRQKRYNLRSSGNIA